ncbi:hypothetical protein DFP74_6154 [Nocardiopsis sp. Huas11]|nr:hypothetical protein DFP74_6154 [Nocardiopsis sp. Huas11]
MALRNLPRPIPDWEGPGWCPGGGSSDTISSPWTQPGGAAVVPHLRPGRQGRRDRAGTLLWRNIPGAGGTPRRPRCGTGARSDAPTGAVDTRPATSIHVRNISCTSTEIRLSVRQTNKGHGGWQANRESAGKHPSRTRMTCKNTTKVVLWLLSVMSCLSTHDCFVSCVQDHIHHRGNTGSAHTTGGGAQRLRPRGSGLPAPYSTGSRSPWISDRITWLSWYCSLLAAGWSAAKCWTRTPSIAGARYR